MPRDSELLSVGLECLGRVVNQHADSEDASADFIEQTILGIITDVISSIKVCTFIAFGYIAVADLVGAAESKRDSNGQYERGDPHSHHTQYVCQREPFVLCTC